MYMWGSFTYLEHVKDSMDLYDTFGDNIYLRWGPLEATPTPWLEPSLEDLNPLCC